MADALLHAIAKRDLPVCPHLPDEHPVRAFWLHGSQALRCSECATAASAELAAVPGCQRCGATDSTRFYALLPTGPVGIIAKLCDACCQAPPADDASSYDHAPAAAKAAEHLLWRLDLAWEGLA